LLQNIPNGSKIHQMAITYTNIFHLQDPTKFSQIGIFGLKIYHLATLGHRCSNGKPNFFPLGYCQGIFLFHPKLYFRKCQDFSLPPR
jgi:hypothetical protein